jgi:hypothetical protein
LTFTKETSFNAPVDTDFVLGGVMHFGKTSYADVDALKRELRIQKTAKEMKFKHLHQSKDFLGCLTESKIIIFLKWLQQSNLYVHFSNVNNLYWAILDIIDSINETTLDNVQINRIIKNELYKIARLHYSDFYQLLVDYNYPNIAKENIRSFYQGLVAFIEAIPNETTYALEYLRQICKMARKQSDVVFLQGNPDKTIIDSYFGFYLRPVGVFSSAQHHFDNENQIENQFGKYRLLHNGKPANNYSFIDSMSNPLIQVSDCIVGLLGKYYTYVNGINIVGAQHTLETLTYEQKVTLKLFVQIIKRSEDFSKLLLHSLESMEEHHVGAYILANAQYL